MKTIRIDQHTPKALKLAQDMAEAQRAYKDAMQKTQDEFNAKMERMAKQYETFIVDKVTEIAAMIHVPWDINHTAVDVRYAIDHQFAIAYPYVCPNCNEEGGHKEEAEAEPRGTLQ